MLINFCENLQEPVIEDFLGLILAAGIPETNAHCIGVQKHIELLLRLSIPFFAPIYKCTNDIFIIKIQKWNFCVNRT